MNEISGQHRTEHRHQLDAVLSRWSGGDVVDGLVQCFDARADLFQDVLEQVQGEKVLYETRLAVVEAAERQLSTPVMAAPKNS